MQLKIKRFIPVISEIRDPLLGEGGWLPSFVQGEFRMNMQFRNCSYKIPIYMKSYFFGIVINLRMVFHMVYHIYDMIASEMIYMTKLLINKMPSWRGRSLTALDLHLGRQMDEGQQHFLHILGALCLIWRRVVEKQKQFLLTDNYQWQRRRWQRQQQQTTVRDVQCALSAPATTTIATTTSTNNNHNNYERQHDDDSLIWLGRPRDFTHEATTVSSSNNVGI